MSTTTPTAQSKVTSPSTNPETVEAPKKKWVTPTNGKDMQDPTTLLWIRVGGTQVEVTPWISMQISAGKMAYVD